MYVQEIDHLKLDNIGLFSVHYLCRLSLTDFSSSPPNNLYNIRTVLNVFGSYSHVLITSH
jgi:hypothetical protein